MAPRAVPEHDEQRWLLKALREAAHELESQLWGLDEDGLRWRPNEDALSLKEIAAHMRDCEEHFVASLELIARRDEPPLPRFDGDVLLLEHDYRDCDLYHALERFAYQRQLAVELLWSPTPEDWDRVGHDPYRGRLTVRQLARAQNEHDLEHLWQARRVRELIESRAAAPR